MSSVNKEELFTSLTNKVAEYNRLENKAMFITSGFCGDDIVIIVLFMCRR